MRRSSAAASWRSSALSFGCCGDDRERDRPALEAREPVDDDGCGGVLVEHRPALALGDDDPEPVPVDPRVPRGPVDRRAEHADLVVHGRLVDVRVGRDLDGREAEREAVVAAEEAEAAAAMQRRRDRGVPVGADPERPRTDLPAAAVGGEDDGDAGHRRGPLREQRLRLGRRQPADVDARDPRARGQLVRRAREREPDPDRDRDERAGDEAHGEVPGPRTGTAAKPSGGSGTPLHAQSAPMLPAPRDAAG